jgi:transcription elongation factor Elf1
MSNADPKIECPKCNREHVVDWSWHEGIDGVHEATCKNMDCEHVFEVSVEHDIYVRASVMEAKK